MKKILLLIIASYLISCSNDDSTTTNQAPANFTVTTEIINNDVTISWTEATDPEGNPVTYDIVLNSENIRTNEENTSYQIDNLSYNTNYEGSVTAKDTDGLTTTSDFSFTIDEQPNTAPTEALLIVPENNSNSNDVEITLSWQAASDNENDPITYSVFIKSGDESFVQYAGNLTENQFNWPGGGIDESHQWYIEATDDKGAKSTSETFSFRTIENTTVNYSNQEPPFPDRDSHATLIFNDKIYLIGGGLSTGGARYNDVWVSENGKEWTELTTGPKFTARLWHSAVVFNNKIWIIGGNAAYSSGNELNDIWSSEDGDTWIQENANPTFAPRYGHRALVYDNHIWVFGGRDVTISFSREEVWKSADGINWTLVTDSANFGAASFDVVVFNDKMWKIGGRGSGVFSSTNGENWQEEINEPAFGRLRFQHSCAVLDGKLWLFSGYNDTHLNPPITDAWYSNDGKEWFLSSDNIGFQAVNFTSTAFRNTIVIIGGATGGSGRNAVNDIYHITPDKFLN
ncbi:fibronectin type III domain-containing protein [Aquimarina sp. MMG015]|uniref:Kelch repeat-containing protein n=1 Tax=Aquimarina sp. MMG015 TaxID=2822689 RepID=UPI001B39F51B|nr:kelch repeat-containing protein [Aquimarina sp. MMG015]MBQ4804889.1 fibronectin type III domain-containing protein [Aquimarina sp. MMG015]